MSDSILQSVAEGKSEAVQACIDAYGGLIWSMARKKGLTQEDAEDVVQEVFIDLWKSASRYDPTKASETAFVAMITRRRLIDRLRREQRRPSTQTMIPEVHDVSGSEHTHLENVVEVALASKALSQLKPKEQRVVLLSTYHGMSHGQIADYTGIPLGTVKTYIRRGLQRVKAMLDEAPPLGEVKA
ncbi:MAG: sigma-70 family RNA polymerase sigma factor [Acidobacteriota bacterium]